MSGKTEKKQNGMMLHTTGMLQYLEWLLTRGIEDLRRMGAGGVHEKALRRALAKLKASGRGEMEVLLAAYGERAKALYHGLLALQLDPKKHRRSRIGPHRRRPSSSGAGSPGVR